MEKRVERDELIPKMRTIFTEKSEYEKRCAVEKHNEKVKDGDWEAPWK
jgi:hypothetical protein